MFSGDIGNCAETATRLQQQMNVVVQSKASSISLSRSLKLSSSAMVVNFERMNIGISVVFGLI